MGLLDDDDRARRLPAESVPFPSPVPARPVSSDEFVPGPQTAKQRELEARIEREAGSSPIPSRATPSATTPTRSSPVIPGSWTTRYSCIPSTSAW